MLRDFFARFETFVRKHQLISDKDRIIVGVSGGVDSIVLLDILNDYRQLHRLEIAVAHVNYHLRGEESNEDEQFVRSLCENYGLPCFVHSVDTHSYMVEHKLSVQVAARNIRYKFYETVKILKNYNKIAVGHNANDNAETVMMNLLRGSGTNGLGGIPVKRGDIIRPLLFAERKDIEQYARLKSLSSRLDSSNTKDYYTRNFIRRSLIPQIQERINPNIVNTLNRTAEIFQDFKKFISNEVSVIYSSVVKRYDEDKVVLDVFKLKNAPLFIQENLIMSAIKEFSDREIDFLKVRAVMDLLESQTGTSVELGRGIYAFRDRYNLVLTRSRVQPQPFFAEIIAGKKYDFDDFYFNSEFVERADLQFTLSPVVEFIDADQAGETFRLRQWEPGDWFVPLGLQGKKKVSDFLIDRKIPLYEKGNVYVLTNKNSVIWVCGLRLDDRFKITDRTRRILKLEFGYK
ncbi:MAG: tRNA lysidine(34) synthetase TilS [Candidatus Kryptoniota bacterium]